MGWAATDGGPWGGIKLLDYTGVVLEEWNDWMVWGERAHPRGPHPMVEFVREVLGRDHVADYDEGAYFVNVVLR